MYIRIATVKFPYDDKANTFIAIMKTSWFEKLEKETLNKEQIMVKTGEGKIVGRGINKSKADFISPAFILSKIGLMLSFI